MNKELRDVTPTEQKYLFQITDENNKVVIQMTTQGKVEFPTGLKVDEATSLFFQSLESHAGGLITMNKNLAIALDNLLSALDILNLKPDNPVIFKAKEMLGYYSEKK